MAYIKKELYNEIVMSQVTLNNSLFLLNNYNKTGSSKPF